MGIAGFSGSSDSEQGEIHICVQRGAAQDGGGVGMTSEEFDACDICRRGALAAC
jgi:hypothetical protein